MSLPEIFKNEIDDNIKNSQYTYQGSLEDNNYRSSSDFDNLPMDAIIETKSGIFNAKIIGKTKNYIVTNKQQIISIDDCISIKKA